MMYPAPKHFGALLTIFCETHQLECCANCAAVEHTGCKIMFIPEMAENISQKREFHDTASNMREQRRYLEELKVTLATEKHELQLDQESIYDTIKKFRTKVNEHLDGLQQQSEQSLEIGFREQEKNIAEEIKKIEAKLDTLNMYLEEFVAYQEAECKLFVEFQKAKQFTRELDNELRRVRTRKARETIKFTLDKKLDKLFKGLTSLGHISRSGTGEFTIADPPIGAARVHNSFM